nr:hypothetical protein [uncultured Roseibium sp.]
MALAATASAEQLRGKTILIDVTVPICGYEDGTQSCVWEHPAWFYLAAIFVAPNDDVFYSLSFHSNHETEGVMISKGQTFGSKSRKTKSGKNVIDSVEFGKSSSGVITVTHLSEWVDDKYIRRNTLGIDVDTEKCTILRFRQEHFSGSQIKYAYGTPTTLSCKVQDGPRNNAYGD